MKRLIIFSAILALTACTSEEPIADLDFTGEKAGTPTFVTFTFNASEVDTKGSSMITDENETNVIHDVRLLIFNATDNAFEVDTTLPSGGGSMITVSLIAGSKRILAIANAGQGMLPAKGSGATYPDFSAATYNISDTYPVTAYTTDIDNLNNLVKPTGYVMTNSTNSSTFILLPGITSSDSQIKGSPNHLSIDLQRTVAKVTVYRDADVSLTTDGRGTLSDLKYSITTVNRSLYLFQQYANGMLQTPEYIPATSIDSALYYHYYTSYNYRELVTDLSASKAVYITENSPSVKKKGNTTFVTVEAVFKPKKAHFVTNISYNEETGAFTVTPSQTDLETASDLYRFKAGVQGLSGNTLLAGVDALKLAGKIIYHLKNPSIASKASLDDPAYAAITDSEIATYFDKYTGGKCYYRLNIGKQAGSGSVDYTIIRNHHYRAKITAYLNMGSNSMERLYFVEDELVLTGPSNITASFNVVDWTVDDIDGRI
jgi:hypothetical protein